MEEQPEQAEHGRADDDQQRLVLREALVEDVEGAAHTGCPRTEKILRAPEPQRGVLHYQHDAERGEELEQLGRLVDAAQ